MATSSASLPSPLTGGRELTIEVAPAWRRLGIGTQLLTRAASQAASRAMDEIVLLAPAEDEGFVSMVCGAGLRARIKVSDGMLTARIVVTGVRRAEPQRPSRGKFRRLAPLDWGPVAPPEGPRI